MQTKKEMLSIIRQQARAIEELCQNIEKAEERTVDKGLDLDKLNTKAKRAPLLNHPLNKEEEQFQKLYLALLISVSNIQNIEGGSNSTASVFMILRIIAGLETQQNYSELYKTSLELEERILDEFTMLLREKNLQRVFALDSLLVAGLVEQKEERLYEYLGELCELLSLSAGETEELTRLAILILEQNAEGYRAFSSEDKSIPLEEYHFYILEFHEGILSDNSELFHLEYRTARELRSEDDFFAKEMITAKTVILKNISFTDIDAKFPLIKDSARVELSNLKFNRGQTALSFSTCAQLLLKDLSFIDINTYKDTNNLVHIDRCLEANITGAKLQRVGYAKDYGNIFSSLKNAKTIFKDCFFSETYPYNGRYLFYTAEDQSFLLQGCRFDYLKGADWPIFSVSNSDISATDCVAASRLTFHPDFSNPLKSLGFKLIENRGKE